MSGKLASDPLFVGLTRPTMIFGVSIQFAMLNMMFSLFIFIYYSGILIIFIATFIHLVGYIACFKEPRFMQIWLSKLAKCNKCQNRYFYGANSYDF
jgi:type IV secretion system protein VirB3